MTEAQDLLTNAVRVSLRCLVEGRKKTIFSPTGEMAVVTEQPTAADIRAALAVYQVAKTEGMGKSSSGMEQLVSKLKDQGLRLADTDNPDIANLIDEDDLEEARKNAV